MVNTTLSRHIDACYLGEIAFQKAATIQRNIAQEVAEDNHLGTFLFLEHHPVITLGKNANESHILASPEVLDSKGITIERTGRGGGVTFHGPGQLIFYPILRVRGVYQVREYVELLQNVVLNTLTAFGIKGVTKANAPGVWVEDRKISSIGIRIHNGIATHGLSLNVFGALSGFSYILACNDAQTLQTTLRNEAQTPADWDTILGIFVRQVETVFGIQLSWRSANHYENLRVLT